MADYEYERIDGQRVQVTVAKAFEKMAEAFKKQFNLELLVTSGTRTSEEQLALYKKYKSGRGNLAAPPGYSNHEENGPTGPRALDLRDSGKNPGVKFAGTKRSNWLKKNCSRFGFTPAGFGFSQVEPWHYEFQGSLTGSKPSESTSKPVEKPAASSGNKYGLSDVRGLQVISQKYAKPGRKTAIDNIWGPLSQEGFDTFLESTYGSKYDAGLAKWLRTKYGYKGDDKYGPIMKAALERAAAANLATIQ